MKKFGWVFWSAQYSFNGNFVKMIFFLIYFWCFTFLLKKNITIFSHGNRLLLIKSNFQFFYRCKSQEIIRSSFFVWELSKFVCWEANQEFKVQILCMDWSRHFKFGKYSVQHVHFIANMGSLVPYVSRNVQMAFQFKTVSTKYHTVSYRTLWLSSEMASPTTHQDRTFSQVRVR